MRAIKKPIEIEYYPCEYDFSYEILQLSTKDRPISIITERPFKIAIETLEWWYIATEKDIIIKWINWEVYPCKKDIFEKTYDKINNL